MGLVPGTLVGGRFRVVDLLGEGGMAQVYRAELCVLGKPVAIKVIRPELMAVPAFVHRFIGEARAASGLSHPNLVSVLDFGKLESGEPYLVMEMCNGAPLAALFALGGLAPSRIVLLFDQIFAAVSEAHAHGVLHLDLKPDNVLVDRWRDGTEFVRVIDFGIARLVGEVDVVGGISGTPCYIAPEILREEEPDGRSDLYSVGVMLYEALAGRPPFEGSVPDIFDGHLRRPPPPLVIDDRSGDAKRLVEIALKALEKHREDRYPDAGAMREELWRAVHRSGVVPRGRPVEVPDFDGPLHLPAAAPESARSSGPQVPPAPEPSAPPLRAAVGDTIALNPVLDPRTATMSWGLASGTPSAPAAMLAKTAPPTPLHAETLNALLQELVPPRPGVRVLVAGEEGAGSTALLRRLVSLASSHSLRAVMVGSDPTGARRPLYSILRALADLIGVRSVLPSVILRYAGQAGCLSAAEQEALRALSGASHLDALPRALRAQEIEGLLADAFEHASRGALVVFDDVSRYDRVSQRVLARMVRAYRSRLSLCVADLPAGLGLGRDDFDKVIAVPALTQQESARLLATTVEGKKSISGYPLPDSASTPLLVRQIGFALLSGVDPSGLSLGELVTARIARLSPPERETLAAAAVWGRAGSLDALAALVSPGVAIALPVALLARAGFLDPTSTEGRYEIAHPMVHAAAYEIIPIGWRRELHRRAREQAERMGASEEVHLHHSVLSLEPARDAVIAHRRRAVLACQGLDFDGAAAVLGEAYRIAREAALFTEDESAIVQVLDVAEEVTALLLELGNPSIADGVLQEVQPYAAAEAARESTWLHLKARVLIVRGRDGEAAEAYRGAIRAAERAGRREALPALYRGVAEVARRLSGPDGALMLLEEGIGSVSPEDGLTPAEGTAVPLAGLARLGIEYAASARECGAIAAGRFAARAARALAVRAGDSYVEALASTELSRCLETPAEAEAALIEAMKAAMRCYHRALAPVILRERARWAQTAGNPGRAAELERQADEWARQTRTAQE